MYALMHRSHHPGCICADELLGVYSTMEDVEEAAARHLVWAKKCDIFVVVECELGKDRAKLDKDEQFICPREEIVNELVELKKIKEGLIDE